MSPDKECLWESIDNRKLDLSCYFDYHKVNRVIITDKAFNNNTVPSDIEVIFAGDVEESIFKAVEERARSRRRGGKTLRVTPGADIDQKTY